MRPVILHHPHLLSALVVGVRLPDRDMALHPDAVDAFFRSFSSSELVQPLNNAFFCKVDGYCAACFSHRKALGEAIDRDDLSRAEKDGTPDSHLANRTASPD